MHHLRHPAVVAPLLAALLSFAATHCGEDSTGRARITAQPSPGTFAELYQAAAKTDNEILSLHISSGLSGTLTSAQLGQAQAAEASTA